MRKYRPTRLKAYIVWPVLVIIALLTGCKKPDYLHEYPAGTKVVFKTSGIRSTYHMIAEPMTIRSKYYNGDQEKGGYVSYYVIDANGIQWKQIFDNDIKAL